jgi:hypothetical protein
MLSPFRTYHPFASDTTLGLLVDSASLSDDTNDRGVLNLLVRENTVDGPLRILDSIYLRSPIMRADNSQVSFVSGTSGECNIVLLTVIQSEVTWDTIFTFRGKEAASFLTAPFYQYNKAESLLAVALPPGTDRSAPGVTMLYKVRGNKQLDSLAVIAGTTVNSFSPDGSELFLTRLWPQAAHGEPGFGIATYDVRNDSVIEYATPSLNAHRPYRSSRSMPLFFLGVPSNGIGNVWLWFDEVGPVQVTHVTDTEYVQWFSISNDTLYYEVKFRDGSRSELRSMRVPGSDK